jgi:hypothetical protein
LRSYSIVSVPESVPRDRLVTSPKALKTMVSAASTRVALGVISEAPVRRAVCVDVCRPRRSKVTVVVTRDVEPRDVSTSSQRSTALSVAS